VIRQRAAQKGLAGAVAGRRVRKSPVGRLLTAFLGVALLTVAIVPAAAANVDKVNVVPNVGHPFGKSYGSWSVAWWQYVLSQPTRSNPLTDPTGAGCGVAQSGPVFFLVGTSGTGTASRDQCVVPAGKALFFPVANAFDVHVPPDGLDTPKLVWNDLQVTLGLSFNSLHATIDGVPVKHLSNVATSPYRACAGPAEGCARSFALTFPADNFFGLKAGTYAPAVADGYYLLLPPLRPGKHTISFGGAGYLNGDFSSDTTYHLTVKR